ncbi:amino acid ABC transporter permease [Desulfonatronovibrio hydrogenovorans]|uniref:amino acid ABC transporter permease n=1 Tax=Desulfonatronovibrio hydrogenovorans TaxID=53245 RepID=UPI00048C372A|nr:amino acid ABC transporter permease [Desulfonatronovibrio hydrogenovorans]
MHRPWMSKNWVQNSILLAIFGAAFIYWGFFFEFGYNFNWSVLYTVNPTYGENFGFYLLYGLKVTLQITLISSVVALALGTFFGLGRLSTFKPFYWVSTAYVEFFRNTPLLVQLFFWYFAMPQALPMGARQWLFGLNYEFWCATIGLAIYTGAFMAEVIRAGIQSIDKGLLEASYSSGLSYFQIMRKIILPLAFRAIIPPLGSEFLNNMKNSSLAMVVGVADLTWQSQQIESLTFRGFEATTAATVIYLSLSLSISGILNTINVRLRRTTQKKADIISYGYNFVSWPVVKLFLTAERLIFRLTPDRDESLKLTRAQTLYKQASQSVWTGLVFLVKAFFLALFIYGLYLGAKGLYSFNWQVIWDNLRTLLIWRFPDGRADDMFMGLGGLSFSIIMSVIAISISFFIGLIVGLGRMSRNNILRIPCMMYIEFIRGNPLIIVIFWVYFFIPVFFNTFISVFWSATIALTIFTGAYIAEIVRGGIQNIPRGQFEAAYSTGLTYFQTMRKIILPQALKQMIPAIVGQFIAIFKDTSLAFVIGVMELTYVAQILNNRLMIYPFEIYTSIAVLYFVCCYAMSILAARLERKLSPDKVRLRM